MFVELAALYSDSNEIVREIFLNWIEDPSIISIKNYGLLIENHTERNIPMIKLDYNEILNYNIEDEDMLRLPRHILKELMKESLKYETLCEHLIDCSNNMKSG